VDVYGLFDLFNALAMPSFMDPNGGVHFGTPPSEQQSTFDPDSYLGQRGTDNSMFGGCRAGDFISENARQVIQDSAENLAMMMPLGEGAEAFNAGEKLAKAKMLADAIKKRNSLKAAAEYAAEHAKTLTDKMLEAAADMRRIEEQEVSRGSWQYENATKAWRELQNQLAKTQQTLQKLLDDLKKAEAHVKSCE